MDTVPSELWSTLDPKNAAAQGAWADHPRATLKSPALAAAAITLLRTPTALAQLSRRREALMQWRTEGGSFSGLPCPIA